MPGTSRFVFAVAAVAATLLSATWPAKAQTQQDIGRCASGDLDARIYGCTALILSGSYNGDTLGKLFAQRGTGLLYKGQFERAIRDFDQAIQILIQSRSYEGFMLGEIFNLRALGYSAKGQFERAFQDHDQAIRLNPQYAPAYNGRCYSAAKLKRELQRALFDCSTSLRLSPNNAYYLHSRGLVYKLMGEYDQTMADFNRSISLNPSLAEAFNDRGETYAFKREFERAIADFDQAILRDPNKWTIAYFLRGHAYLSLGRPDQALADFRRALVFFPNNQAVADAIQQAQQQVAKEAVERANTPAATGSSLLISEFGYIFTNQHVVDGCVKVRVRSPIGAVEATATASDKANDLALLRADVRDLTPLAFRDGGINAATGSSGIRPADPIVAIGFPYSGLLATSPIISTGIVSALAGLMDDTRFFQISAPIQPGNSGGPLLDSSGNVVGVIVSTISASTIMKYTGSIPQNINFAIKGDIVRQFLDVNRIAYATAKSETKLDLADVGEKGSRLMVLVECYK